MEVCSLIEPEVHLSSDQLLKTKVNLSRKYRESVLKDERRFDHDFTLGKLIAVSGPTRVCKCKCLLTEKWFAVKIYDNVDISDSQREAFVNELMINCSVKHESLGTLVDIYKDEAKVYAVHELAQCDLYDRFKERGGFDEATVATMLKQLLKGIDYLHQNGIMHRDIKVENVLCYGDNESNTVKLSDFGHSMRMKDLQEKTFQNNENNLFGTPHYIPPEIIRGFSYTYEADIWSTGVMVFCLLVGYFPFDDERSMKRLFRKIMNGRLKFHCHYWAGISDLAVDFVSKMLRRDPFKRWNASQLLKHEWIRKYAKDA